MPPTILVLKRTTPVQVYEMTPTFLLTQDGSDVSGAPGDDRPGSTSALAYSRISNPLCEAFGKRFLRTGTTIRERDEGGDGNWGVVYTFSEPAALNGYSGLAICNANGQEIMGCMYNDGTNNNIRVVWTTDGSSWNEVEAFNPSSGNLTNWGKITGFRSSLYWFVEWNNGTHSFFTYDFAANVGGAIVGPGSSVTEGTSSYFTVHKNKIYLIGYNGGSFRWSIIRLDGTSYTTVWTGADGFDSGWPASGMGCNIFTDPGSGDLIAIFQYNDGSLNEYGARSIANADTSSGLTDASGDVTDISGAVIPASLKGIANGGTLMEAYIDNVTVPATPVAFLIYNTRPGINDSPQNLGTGHLWYQWQGVGGTMTLVGTPLTTAAAWAIPSATRGGGERVKTSPAGRPTFDGGIVLTHGTVTSGPFLVDDVLTGTSGTATVRTVYSGSLDVDITSGTFSNTDSIAAAPSGASATLTADSDDLATPIEVPGGTTKVFFRVLGAGSAITLEVRLSTNEEPPSVQMGLISTSVTIEAGIPATTPGNTSTQITSITPDEGATIYSVQLDTTSAGVGAGDAYSIMLVPV